MLQGLQLLIVPGVRITPGYAEWEGGTKYSGYPMTPVDYKPVFDFHSFLGCQLDQIPLHYMNIAGILFQH
jgi:hypothetical protein